MSIEHDKHSKMPHLRVGICKDLAVSALVAACTLAIWYYILSCFGEPGKLNTSFVTFLGGVLAISGLLFRQYMLKEVLDYLKQWEKMEKLLNEIQTLAEKSGKGSSKNVQSFNYQRTQVTKYWKYVRRELNLVPIVPLLLILFYGCALLAENSVKLRFSFLFLMIFCVTYLAIASLGSTRLAYMQSDLSETVTVLEELRNDLEKM